MSGQFIERVTHPWADYVIVQFVARQLPNWGDTSRETKGEGAGMHYWDFGTGTYGYGLGSRPVLLPYYPGDDVTAPSRVPFHNPSDDMPWSQDLHAFALEAIARGAIQPADVAALLNEHSFQANAAVNPDYSISWDTYTYDDSEFEDMLGLALFVAPLGLMILTHAGVIAAAGGVASGAAAPEVASAAVDWEAVASGWEGLAADSAIQNVALAEVTGQVAPGTLAEMIGEQAARTALEAANAIANAPAVSLPQTPPSPPTQTSSPPSKIPLNANTIRQAGQLLQYGSQLYRMVAGSDETGAPILIPQRAGYVDPQGNLIYSGAGSNMGGALLALLGLGLAGAIVLRS